MKDNEQDYIVDETSDEFGEGLAAYKAKVDMDDNPHASTGTLDLNTKRYLWFMGWLKGKYEK